MFSALRVGFCLVCMIGSASAQTSYNQSPPLRIGNIANGFDYQPTPRQVVPLETSLGLRPPKGQEDKANDTLEAIDRQLLRSEGLPVNRVPAFGAAQP